MEVEQLLEVETGRAQPTTIGLSPGDTVGPLSIGRMGGWRVAANGVAAEHGWFYFDGRQLYLQSVDPAAPLYVDGQPVPTSWTPVHAPCTIALGAARIGFIAAAEEIERTADKFPAPAAQAAAAAPRPPTPPRSVRPFAPGELAHRPEEADATRMGAIDVVAARARASALSSSRSHGDAAGDAPASGSGRSQAPPSSAPLANDARAEPPSAAPPAALRASPAPGSIPVRPATAPLGEQPTTIQPVKPAAAGLYARWNEASVAQKATVFLLPLALASVYVIFADLPQPDDDGAVGDEPAGDEGPAAGDRGDAPPEGSGAAIVAAPITASPRASTTAGTIEAAPAPPPPATSAPRVAARPGSASQRTLERRAADSVAAGDWDGAAELYEQLAQQHPDQPAFAEAARILRARGR